MASRDGPLSTDWNNVVAGGTKLPGAFPDPVYAIRATLGTGASLHVSPGPIARAALFSAHRGSFPAYRALPIRPSRKEMIRVLPFGPVPRTSSPIRAASWSSSRLQPTRKAWEQTPG
jgi:hypothetical protein